VLRKSSVMAAKMKKLPNNLRLNNET